MVSQRYLALDRADVDQRAEALSSELAHGRVASVDHALEIDVHNPRMVLDGDVFEAPQCSDRCVVDPHVDTAEAFDGGLGQALYVGWFAHIGGHYECRPSCLAYLRSQFFEHRGSAGRQHHVALQSGKPERHAATEATGGTSDDEGFASYAWLVAWFQAWGNGAATELQGGKQKQQQSQSLR